MLVIDKHYTLGLKPKAISQQLKVSVTEVYRILNKFQKQSKKRKLASKIELQPQPDLSGKRVKVEERKAKERKGDDPEVLAQISSYLDTVGIYELKVAAMVAHLKSVLPAKKVPCATTL